MVYLCISQPQYLQANKTEMGIVKVQMALIKFNAATAPGNVNNESHHQNQTPQLPTLLQKLYEPKFLRCILFAVSNSATFWGYLESIIAMLNLNTIARWN